METTHTILVSLVQRVDGYTLLDLDDLRDSINGLIGDFVKPKFEGDRTTILGWEVTTDDGDAETPGLRLNPNVTMFPRVFDTGAALGTCKVKYFRDLTVDQFDYIFIPKLGVFNVLNLEKRRFDKTGLCKAVDEMLRQEGYYVR